MWTYCNLCSQATVSEDEVRGERREERRRRGRRGEEGGREERRGKGEEGGGAKRDERVEQQKERWEDNEGKEVFHIEATEL